jgi:hypothetical protein
MNFIAFSPHFPPNYAMFWTRLRALGVTVLGLADEWYGNLAPALKNALLEYYRVPDMHNYDQLLRAVGYFTHRYGKIDRIESHNEYWLETEARLRTDFNIPGVHTSGIQRIKRKSEMKKIYIKAGVPVARGGLVRTPAQARRLVNQVGYPLIAKPDTGVGASATYKIRNAAEMERFWALRPPVDYCMEQFVEGVIHSFDGLADQDGNLVFYTSHVFSQGIMETVNDDLDISYYSQRVIPPDLEQAGRAVAHAFDLRERFFHFEFFRTAAGSLVALEVNMRPPGGLTTDMFNFANDIDVYREYASVVVRNRFEAKYTRPYHCAYVGRKHNHLYAHSHEEIVDVLGETLVGHEALSGAFAPALGNEGYLVRSPNLDDVLEMVEFIQERAEE